MSCKHFGNCGSCVSDNTWDKCNDCIDNSGFKCIICKEEKENEIMDKVLTLKEVKQMDGDPVWVENNYGYEAYLVNVKSEAIYNKNGGYLIFSNISENLIKVYKEKPLIRKVTIEEANDKNLLIRHYKDNYEIYLPPIKALKEHLLKLAKDTAQVSNCSVNLLNIIDLLKDQVWEVEQ